MERRTPEDRTLWLLERIASALEAQVEATHRLADLQEQTIDPDEPTMDNPEGTLDPPTGELFSGKRGAFIGGATDNPSDRCNWDIRPGLTPEDFMGGNLG